MKKLSSLRFYTHAEAESVRTEHTGVHDMRKLANRKKKINAEKRVSIIVLHTIFDFRGRGRVWLAM
jgi:hypothetical protein